MQFDCPNCKDGNALQISLSFWGTKYSVSFASDQRHFKTFLVVFQEV